MPSLPQAAGRSAAVTGGAGRHQRSEDGSVRADGTSAVARQRPGVAGAIAIVGLALMGTASGMSLLSVQNFGDAVADAERWVVVARGTFGTVAAILLAAGIAVRLTIAFWLATGLALLTLIDVVVRDQPAIFSYPAQILEAVGASLVAVANGARSIQARMRRAASAPSGVGGAWYERLVRGVLVVEAIAMVAWLFAHAMVLMLAGLVGFYEYWRLPFGIGVLALVVIAGVNYRPGSRWAVGITFAALVGSIAAFVIAYRPDASPTTQAAILVATALAIVGIALLLVRPPARGDPDSGVC